MPEGSVWEYKCLENKLFGFFLFGNETLATLYPNTKQKNSEKEK